MTNETNDSQAGRPTLDCELFDPYPPDGVAIELIQDGDLIPATVVERKRDNELVTVQLDLVEWRDGQLECDRDENGKLYRFRRCDCCSKWWSVDAFPVGGEPHHALLMLGRAYAGPKGSLG